MEPGCFAEKSVASFSKVACRLAAAYTITVPPSAESRVGESPELEHPETRTPSRTAAVRRVVRIASPGV
ncbi:hypothetical protein GCM10009551_099700 [Nocardiopsis tropica]|nr:hypothetical protein TTY48_32600 [Tsukamurella sp. TY48]